MTAERRHHIAPFVSVTMAVMTLLFVVFCKMELRRVGYSILVLNRQHRLILDDEREQEIRLARITRPERMQSFAETHLTLKKAVAGQIIQMTEGGIALRQ